MCDQTEVEYKGGDVVWCKLGNLWWPAQVQDQSNLDEEVTQGLKKKPLAVVKFFNEDYYDFIKDINHICHYNTSRKFEFIKKGMASYRSGCNINNISKFPEDITKAEELTGGNIDILKDKRLLPEEKISYKEFFSTPKAQKDNKNLKKLKNSVRNRLTPSGPNSLTPKFAAMLSSKKYFHKYMIQDAKQPVSETAYICPYCKLTFTRVGALYNHNIYTRYNCAKDTSKSTKSNSSFMKLEKSALKRRSILNESPQVKKKPKLMPVKGVLVESTKKVIKVKTAVAKESKEKDKKKSEAMREQILLDWDEENDEAAAEGGHSSPVGKREEKLSESAKKTSCFDFEDNDEDVNLDRSIRFGQKLPRVIPKEDKTKDNKSKDKGMSDDDTLEMEFNNIMKETSVPVVPIVTDSFLSDSSALPGSPGKAEANLGSEANNDNKLDEVDYCKKSEDDNASLLRALECDSPAEMEKFETTANTIKRANSSICEEVTKKLRSDADLLASLRSDSDSNSGPTDRNLFPDSLSKSTKKSSDSSLKKSPVNLAEKKSSEILKKKGGSKNVEDSDNLSCSYNDETPRKMRSRKRISGSIKVADMLNKKTDECKSDEIRPADSIKSEKSRGTLKCIDKKHKDNIHPVLDSSIAYCVSPAGRSPFKDGGMAKITNKVRHGKSRKLVSDPADDIPKKIKHTSTVKSKGPITSINVSSDFQNQNVGHVKTPQIETSSEKVDKKHSRKSKSSRKSSSKNRKSIAKAEQFVDADAYESSASADESVEKKIAQLLAESSIDAPSQINEVKHGRNKMKFSKLNQADSRNEKAMRKSVAVRSSKSDVIQKQNRKTDDPNNVKLESKTKIGQLNSKDMRLSVGSSKKIPKDKMKTAADLVKKTEVMKDNSNMSQIKADLKQGDVPGKLVTRTDASSPKSKSNTKSISKMKEIKTLSTVDRKHFEEKTKICSKDESKPLKAKSESQSSKLSNASPSSDKKIVTTSRIAKADSTTKKSRYYDDPTIDLFKPDIIRSVKPLSKSSGDSSASNSPLSRSRDDFSPPAKLVSPTKSPSQTFQPDKSLREAPQKDISTNKKFSDLQKISKENSQVSKKSPSKDKMIVTDSKDDSKKSRARSSSSKVEDDQKVVKERDCKSDRLKDSSKSTFHKDSAKLEKHKDSSRSERQKDSSRSPKVNVISQLDKSSDLTAKLSVTGIGDLHSAAELHVEKDVKRSSALEDEVFNNNHPNIQDVSLVLSSYTHETGETFSESLGSVVIPNSAINHKKMDSNVEKLKTDNIISVSSVAETISCNASSDSCSLTTDESKTDPSCSSDHSTTLFNENLVPSHDGGLPNHQKDLPSCVISGERARKISVVNTKSNYSIETSALEMQNLKSTMDVSSLDGDLVSTASSQEMPRKIDSKLSHNQVDCIDDTFHNNSARLDALSSAKLNNSFTAESTNMAKQVEEEQETWDNNVPISFEGNPESSLSLEPSPKLKENVGHDNTINQKGVSGNESVKPSKGISVEDSVSAIKSSTLEKGSTKKNELTLTGNPVLDSDGGSSTVINFEDKSNEHFKPSDNTKIDDQNKFRPVAGNDRFSVRTDEPSSHHLSDILPVKLDTLNKLNTIPTNISLMPGLNKPNEDMMLDKKNSFGLEVTVQTTASDNDFIGSKSISSDFKDNVDDRNASFNVQTENLSHGNSGQIKNNNQVELSAQSELTALSKENETDQKTASNVIRSEVLNKLGASQSNFDALSGKAESTKNTIDSLLESYQPTNKREIFSESELSFDDKLPVASEVVISTEPDVKNQDNVEDESNIYNFDDQLGSTPNLFSTPQFSSKAKPKTSPFGDVKINLKNSANVIDLPKDFPTKIISADFLTPDKIKEIFNKGDSNSSSENTSSVIRPIVVPPQAILEDKVNNTETVVDGSNTSESSSVNQGFSSQDVQNMELDINSMPVVIADEMASSVSSSASVSQDSVGLAPSSVGIRSPCPVAPVSAPKPTVQSVANTVPDHYIKLVKPGRFRPKPNRGLYVITIPGVKSAKVAQFIHHTPIIPSSRIVQLVSNKSQLGNLSNKGLFVMTPSGKKRIILKSDRSHHLSGLGGKGDQTIGQRSLVVTVPNPEAGTSGKSKVNTLGNVTSRTVQLLSHGSVKSASSKSLCLSSQIKVYRDSKLIGFPKIPSCSDNVQKKIRYKEPSVKTARIPSIMARSPSLARQGVNSSASSRPDISKEQSISFKTNKVIPSVLQVSDTDSNEASRLIVSTKASLDNLETLSAKSKNTNRLHPKEDILAKALADTEVFQGTEVTKDASSVSGLVDPSLCENVPSSPSFTSLSGIDTPNEAKTLPYNVDTTLFTAPGGVQPSMPLLSDETAPGQSIALTSNETAMPYYQVEGSQFIVATSESKPEDTPSIFSNILQLPLTDKTEAGCVEETKIQLPTSTTHVTADVNLAEIELPPGHPPDSSVDSIPLPEPYHDISCIPLPLEPYKGNSPVTPSQQSEYGSTAADELPESFQSNDTSDKSLASFFQSVSNS